MTTTLKPKPLTLPEATLSLPRFAVGQEVRTWCMGLVSPDFDGTVGGSKIRVLVCRIEGVRLRGKDHDEGDDDTGGTRRVVEYPKGWEYLAVAPDGSDDGWYSEAALLDKGYTPAR